MNEIIEVSNSNLSKQTKVWLYALIYDHVLKNLTYSITSSMQRECINQLSLILDKIKDEVPNM